MDLSIENVWRCWFLFKKGKKYSKELEEYIYCQEKYLWRLFEDLRDGNYKHGGYKRFEVCDNKRREIAVSSITDRIVHRIIYEYLVPIFDQGFIFDVWSCRKGKGLVGALDRVQMMMRRYADCYVWRADVKKFFDNVDQRVLYDLIGKKVADNTALWLVRQVIESYNSGVFGKGIPIGNLTSQIFANIYLSELDRFVMNEIKPLAYLRYGDDFVVFGKSDECVEDLRKKVIVYIEDFLKLKINKSSNLIIKAGWGLKFMGCRVFTYGRRLNNRNWRRLMDKVNLKNTASYYGLIMKNEMLIRKKLWDWLF
ncbi:MAG TPA: reverse transcriptase/maturase family protein [Candidatus Gracilibacteria bacterium]|nr:reverse transcriptase/maturase family protein [Candidatus Gracilibacteria bacterium]